jgi:hypothetical protein
MNTLNATNPSDQDLPQTRENQDNAHPPKEEYNSSLTEEYLE